MRAQIPGLETVVNQHFSASLHSPCVRACGDNIFCRAAQRPGEVGKGCEFCVNSPCVNLTEKSLSSDNSMPTCVNKDCCNFVGLKRYSLTFRILARTSGLRHPGTSRI